MEEVVLGLRGVSELFLLHGIWIANLGSRRAAGMRLEAPWRDSERVGPLRRRTR